MSCLNLGLLLQRGEAVLKRSRSLRSPVGLLLGFGVQNGLTNAYTPSGLAVCNLININQGIKFSHCFKWLTLLAANGPDIVIRNNGA